MKLKIIKHFIFIATLVLLSSCNSDKIDKKKMEKSSCFYVGTYTNGSSEGIYKYKLSENGKLDSVGLVAKSNNPSFLTLSKDNKYLLCCNEVNSVDGKGTVESYRIGKDSLEFVSRSSSGGAHPCFVTTNNDNVVLVANYTGGNVGLLKLKNKGCLSKLLDLQQHTAKNISERQDKAHAHSSWFIPGTDNKIVSVDLGTNELIFSEIIDEGSKFSTDKKVLTMVPGSGPRHLAIHKKGWMYVVNELNSTVTQVVKNSKNEYEIEASISTLPSNFEGDSFCGDIHISLDGKFLYVSNRGHNSIAVFKINQGNGELSTVSFHNVKGSWPRNFTLSKNGNFLLVANQKTNNIVSFKVNKENGELTFVDEINAPIPVCLVFE